MSKKKLEVKQEMLEEHWKLLSKPREVDLICAGKEIRGHEMGRRQVVRVIPAIPYLSSTAHCHLLPQQHHPTGLSCGQRSHILLQSLVGLCVSTVLWLLVPSTCLCSRAAAGKSICSADVFLHSLEEHAFWKRGGREQRKNWRWGRRK